MATKKLFIVEKVFATFNEFAVSLCEVHRENASLVPTENRKHAKFDSSYGVPQPGTVIPVIVNDGGDILWAALPNKKFIVASPEFSTPFRQILQGNGRRGDAKEIQQALRVLAVTTNQEILNTCVNSFNQIERKAFSGIKSREPYRLALSLLQQYGAKE